MPTIFLDIDGVPPAPDLPKFLTVGEVAELLRCNPKTIHRRIAAGLIAAVRSGGGRLLVPCEAIESPTPHNPAAH